jgi:hypothetical protein
MRRCSARLSSSPARMMTMFVASPICAACSARDRAMRVEASAHLGLLRLGREDEELRGRVHDLDLADDRRGVARDEELAEVVDQQFVPPCAARASAAPPHTHAHARAPLGPKEVRTRSESSPTAWMFRSTASSMPWRCYFARAQSAQIGRARGAARAQTL